MTETTTALVTGANKGIGREVEPGSPRSARTSCWPRATRTAVGSRSRPGPAGVPGHPGRHRPRQRPIRRRWIEEALAGWTSWSTTPASLATSPPEPWQCRTARCTRGVRDQRVRRDQRDHHDAAAARPLPRRPDRQCQQWTGLHRPDDRSRGLLHNPAPVGRVRPVQDRTQLADRAVRQGTAQPRTSWSTPPIRGRVRPTSPPRSPASPAPRPTARPWSSGSPRCPMTGRPAASSTSTARFPGELPVREPRDGVVGVSPDGMGEPETAPAPTGRSARVTRRTAPATADGRVADRHAALAGYSVQVRIGESGAKLVFGWARAFRQRT